jgi:hypothetical protein
LIPNLAPTGVPSVPAPVVIVRTVTAASDPAQRMGGPVQASTPEGMGRIADGPFFLTDYHGTGAWLVSTGTPCSTLTPFVVAPPQGSRYLHGIQFFVPPGQTLCSLAGDGEYWGGFRPY